MSLSSSSSMTTLLQVDLTSLSPDVVVQYSSKVVLLQLPRAISQVRSASRHHVYTFDLSSHLSGLLDQQEKLQMLFVLSQKLLRWFLEERSEMERVNQKLEQELLDVLESASADTKLSIPASQVNQCQQRTQQDLINSPSHGGDSSVLADDSQPTHFEASDFAEVSESADNVLSRSEDLVVLMETPVEAEHDEISTSTHEEEASAPPHVLESLQSESTADEAAPAWQIFPEDRNLLYIATNDHEPKNKSTRHSDKRALEQGESLAAITLYTPPADVSVTASAAEQPKLSPLEVYEQVHGSVVRLQKFTRGYLTRRRFFRMLEELVMKN